MIGKQRTGRGFNGLLKYALNPSKGYLVGGNMAGITPRDLANEFAESQKLKPNLRKPVYHASLSISPQESLNDAQWIEIASRYLQEMGFTFSMYCVARHTDQDHEHVHIVASRIGLDGRTVSDSNNYSRSERIIRQIEKDYGLQQVKSSREVDRRALTSGELRNALKTNRPSVRMLLQEIIEKEAKKSLTMAALANNLRALGVEIIPNLASTGRMSGLSFKYHGEIMKGSDLGRGFSFSGLQKKGIHYDPYRDNAALVSERNKDQKTDEQYLVNTVMKRNFKR